MSNKLSKGWMYLQKGFLLRRDKTCSASYEEGNQLLTHGSLDFGGIGTRELCVYNMGDDVEAEASRKNLTFVQNRLNKSSAMIFLLKILKTSSEVWRCVNELKVSAELSLIIYMVTC